MAIYNLGSINIDKVYQVPHLPAPGETLAASEISEGLGGKGANMSVAAARGAGHVCHIGAIGNDGHWARDRLMEYGVDARFVFEVSASTGHAVINVDQSGENAIVLWPGANVEISKDQIGQALSEASTGDTLLMQNETNNQLHAAQIGKELGLRVAYAAAPFHAQTVQDLLPFVDLLFLNEIEAQQLSAATGAALNAMPASNVVVTLGAEGCVWYDNKAGLETHIPALKVVPVDTTGAGDTFTGYVLAGLDRGMPMLQAIRLATQAGALMVTRHGTADVIPDLKEIQDAGLS